MAVITGGIMILLIKHIKPSDYKDALDYWENMKKNKWEELSPDQRKKLLRASLLIDGYRRGFTDYESILNALNKQLPIMTKTRGLIFNLKQRI